MDIQKKKKKKRKTHTSPRFFVSLTFYIKTPKEAGNSLFCSEDMAFHE
jgi:hypothetical protein